MKLSVATATICFLLCIWKCTTFDYVSSPITSFTYEGQTIRIWPSAKNGPEIRNSFWNFRYSIPKSLWNFFYDPVILPVLNGNGTIKITTKEYGSRWQTSFFLTLDSPTLKRLADNATREAYKGTDNIHIGNVIGLPVKKITVTFPHLLDGFPDVNLTSPSVDCPPSSSCHEFYTQVDLFRVTFLTATREKAFKFTEALQSSVLRYEIKSYARIQYASMQHNDSNPITVIGYLDLSTIALTTSLISQEAGKRLMAMEEKMMMLEAVTCILAKSIEKIASNTSQLFDNFANRLENLPANISTTNLTTWSNFQDIKKRLMAFEEKMMILEVVTSIVIVIDKKIASKTSQPLDNFFSRQKVEEGLMAIEENMTMMLEFVTSTLEKSTEEIASNTSQLFDNFANRLENQSADISTINLTIWSNSQEVEKRVMEIEGTMWIMGFLVSNLIPLENPPSITLQLLDNFAKRLENQTEKRLIAAEEKMTMLEVVTSILEKSIKNIVSNTSPLLGNFANRIENQSADISTINLTTWSISQEAERKLMAIEENVMTWLEAITSALGKFSEKIAPNTPQLLENLINWLETSQRSNFSYSLANLAATLINGTRPNLLKDSMDVTEPQQRNVSEKRDEIQDLEENLTSQDQATTHAIDLQTATTPTERDESWPQG